MPLTEEMKKSIEEIVDQTFSDMKAQSEKESEEEVKKSEDEKDEKEDKKEDKKDPAKKDEKKDYKKDMKKSDEDSEEDPEKEAELEKGVKSGEAPKDSTPENGGKDSIKSGSPYQEGQSVKKSIEELSSVLTQDEVELITAWREETTEVESVQPVETVAKSQGGLTDTDAITKSIKEAVSEATSDLKKAIGDKDEVIKSMQEQIQKMADRPAYDKRSVDSLETVEKSGDSNSDNISKSQVLETMLDMQKSGKGINAYHVAEMEATGNLSNPKIRQLVQDACKKA